MNYMEEDSSEEDCGCWRWCSAGASWPGNSFCRMLSSSAVANPSSLAVSETWERKAVTKTQEWRRQAWQLWGYCLLPPQLYLTVNINILTEITAVKSADRQSIQKQSQNMDWKRSTQASISSKQEHGKGRDLSGLQEERRRPHATQINDNEKHSFDICTWL